RLFIDARSGRETRLVRCSPTMTNGLERLVGSGFYVLSGDLHADGARLELGDYGTLGRSPLVRSDLGCVLFTTIAPGNSKNAPSESVVLRARDGAWRPMSEGSKGVSVKDLMEDQDRGLRMRVLRMETGATWGAHHHDVAEELFVIRGDWRCLGTTF